MLPTAGGPWTQELVRRKPGIYTVWVEYFGDGAGKLGIEELSLRSNEVRLRAD